MHNAQAAGAELCFDTLVREGLPIMLRVLESVAASQALTA